MASLVNSFSIDPYAILITEVIRVAAARAARRVPEESPDSTGQRCRLTAGRGNPPESATETYRRKSARGRGKGEMVRPFGA